MSYIFVIYKYGWWCSSKYTSINDINIIFIYYLMNQRKISLTAAQYIIYHIIIYYKVWYEPYKMLLHNIIWNRLFWKSVYLIKKVRDNLSIIKWISTIIRSSNNIYIWFPLCLFPIHTRHSLGNSPMNPWIKRFG